MAGRYVGFGKKLFDLAKGESKSNVATTIVGVAPKVNKTKLDEAKSKLNIAIQKTKASSAKLGQTLFESKNKAFKKDDFTFAKTNKKTESNTEKAKKIFKKEDKKENKTKVFIAPKNFNKGGRVGLRFGSKKKSNVQKIKCLLHLLRVVKKLNLILKKQKKLLKKRIKKKLKQDIFIRLKTLTKVAELV